MYLVHCNGSIARGEFIMGIEASIADRTFADFRWNEEEGRFDDPRKLAGGVLREVASVLGIDIGRTDEPDPRELDVLVNALDPDSQGLRENPDLTLEKAAWLVGRSRILAPLDRWVRDPKTPIPEDHDVVLVATGGTASQQDRTRNLLAGMAAGRHIVVAAGNRVMDSPVEQRHPNVRYYQQGGRTWPTEAEYTNAFVVPELQPPVARSANTLVTGGLSGSEVVAAILEDAASRGHDLHTTRSRIAAVGVGGTAVPLALELRRAARSLSGGEEFDSGLPQMFVRASPGRAAITPEQLNNLSEFDDPYLALREMARAAVLLAEQS